MDKLGKIPVLMEKFLKGERQVIELVIISTTKEWNKVFG